MPSNNTIRMCAAGSGKTWNICNDALSNVPHPRSRGKMALITTFTNKGIDTVNSELAKQNLGVPSSRIIVRSWYQFLMTELIRPYQSYITDINTIHSFDFQNSYGKINFERVGTAKRYFSGEHLVKQNNASELAIYLNENSNGAVIKRLEQIYSHIYIDEFQDMTGYDLDIVRLLFASSIFTVCVGDNKQATYRTHNTRTKRGQSGKNLWNFCSDAQSQNMAIIEESMESRRFNGNICAFVNSIFPNDNNITTSMSENTEHDGVYLIAQIDVKQYCDYFRPIVLKYDKTTDVGGVASFNFGQCKGMTFDRVLIYPNKPLKNFLCGKKLSSPEKYYVAVTRPKFSLVIVLDTLPVNTLFEPVQIQIAGIEIQALRFIS